MINLLYKAFYSHYMHFNFRAKHKKQIIRQADIFSVTMKVDNYLDTMDFSNIFNKFEKFSRNHIFSRNQLSFSRNQLFIQPKPTFGFSEKLTFNITTSHAISILIYIFFLRMTKVRNLTLVTLLFNNFFMAVECFIQ